MRIAVTGATGHLGGHVIDALISKGVAAADIVAIYRNEAKGQALLDKGVTGRVADYTDADALAAALQGVDRMVLVSGSEVGQRLAQHTNIINAAKAADVKFIAYTSLLNLDTSALALVPEHKATEELLRDSGIEFAALRNGWYWENYASALQTGKAVGKFFGAAGGAVVSGAARRDYAEAAAVVVTGEGHAGKVYELAGAPELTYQGIADEAAKVIGSPVAYENQTIEEYAATLESFGVPAEMAGILAGMESDIEAGALYSESTDLADLIGRPSTSAAEAFSS